MTIIEELDQALWSEGVLTGEPFNLTIIKEGNIAYVVDRNAVDPEDLIVTTATLHADGLYRIDDLTSLENFMPHESATEQEPSPIMNIIINNISTKKSEHRKQGEKSFKQGARKQSKRQDCYNDLNPLEILHVCMNHASRERILWHVKSGAISGLQFTYDEVKRCSMRQCDTCKAAKTRRQSIYSSYTIRTYLPLQRIYMDVMFFGIRSINGYHAILLIGDVCTDTLFPFGLADVTSENVALCLEKLFKMYGHGVNRVAVKTQFINFDNGMENLGTETMAFLRKEDIRPLLSAARRKEQSRTERSVQTVKAGTRAALAYNKAPLYWFAHAVTYFCYIHNRTAKFGENQTRLEKLTGEKSDGSMFAPFYADGWAFTEPDLRKNKALDDRARLVKLIGFADLVSWPDQSAVAEANADIVFSHKNSYLVADGNKTSIVHDVTWKIYSEERASAMNQYRSKPSYSEADLDAVIDCTADSTIPEPVDYVGDENMERHEIDIPDNALMSLTSQPDEQFFRKGGKFFACDTETPKPSNSGSALADAKEKMLKQALIDKCKPADSIKLPMVATDVEEGEDEGDVIVSSSNSGSDSEDDEPRHDTNEQKNKSHSRAFINALMDKHVGSRSDPEPITIETISSLEEGFSGPDREHWIKAYLDETSKIEDRKTLEICNDEEQFDNNIKAIKSKFAFRLTILSGGIRKYKVRLVACGYSQVAGRDHDNTFSPTVKAKSVKTILSLAANKNWEIKGFDVESAFLEAELEENEKIYMYLPREFRLTADPTKLVKTKLLRNIYGLKQAGYNFYRLIRRILVSFGFAPSDFDQCVFIKWSHKGKSVIVILFVDDGTVTGSWTIGIDETIRYLEKAFTKIKVNEEVLRFIGIDIKRNRKERTITISQQPYIDSLLSKHPDELKPKPTPLLSSVDYRTKGDGSNEPIHSAVGTIRYLADNTEPILLASASALGSAAAQPSDKHVQGVQQVARYLKGQENGMTLGGDEIDLFAMTDANLVLGHDGKSQLGFAFYLNKNSGTIHARSKKDTTVSLASTESEIKAIELTCIEAIWLRGLLKDLGFLQIHPTVIHTDSASAIIMAENNSSSARTGHYANKISFINQCIENGSVALRFVNSEENVADALTKLLPKQKVAKFRHTLNHGHGGESPISLSRIEYTKMLSSKKKQQKSGKNAR